MRTASDSADENKRNYVALILFLISLLILNPAVLFLLTKNLLVSIIAPVLLFFASIASYTRFRSRLVTIYLINIFALISIFIHAEVIFFINFKKSVIEEIYLMKDGYDFNKPNLQMHFADREYAADYFTNCQGYRIPKGWDPKVKVDTADWLFIGDSFTQGAQVNFEDLYSTLIYRKNPNKIVVNAGISGAGIVEELRYYRDFGRLLKSKTVVLQIGSFNDFMRVERERTGISDYLAYYSKFARFMLQNIKYKNPSTLPLGRWVEPFQPDQNANRDFNVFYRKESHAKTRDYELFKQYLQLFNDEVRKQSAKLIVFLLPTREQIDFNSWQEVITAYRIQPSELDMLKPNNLLRQFTDELGITFIDMLEPMRTAKGKVYFEYDEHLTLLGHQILADELSKHMPAGSMPQPLMLTQELVGDRYPNYTKEGSLITFQSQRDGTPELYIADQHFYQIRRLTSNNLVESHPILSNDGSMLAFTEGEADIFQTKVFISELNNTNERISLTEGADVFGAIPWFSPDDKSLAFAEWHRTDNRQFSNPQIVVINLSTKEKRYITKADYESWRPVFSPDGRRLIYISKHRDQFDLYFFYLETGREERITWTPYDEWDPQFSSDGKRIIYSAKADGNWDLFIYDLQLGETYRITESRGDEWDATFNRAGNKIVYAGRYGLIEGIYETQFSCEHPFK
jgi:hypothetical protein